MATTEQPTTFIGSPQLRKEDPELLTGEGRFTDDIAVPGMLWLGFVRSPFAHAKYTKVDTSKALAMNGVVAAYSAADLEFAAPLFMAFPLRDLKQPPHWPLAKDKARYVGDPVAVVVAESRALAKDAAELVDVDWVPLPAVTDVRAALASGAPAVHDDLGTNHAGTWDFELDSPAPTRADPGPYFEDAGLVKVTGEYFLARLIPNAIEPRSVLAVPNISQGEFTLYTASQIPHFIRTFLTIELGIPEAKMRVIAPDVGGGFGSKLEHYGEEAVAVAVARQLGRPIKWTEERAEGYLTTIHGRDMYQTIELAATRDGDLKAVRVKLLASMGAYLRVVSPAIPMLGAWLYAGVYDPEAYDFAYDMVFTNTTPTDAYRGAGRPEATYAIERTMDRLADELGMDPVELRRRNMIKKDNFPNYTIVSGLTVDSGNYEGTLDKCLQRLDYEGFRRKQAERRQQGSTKLLGVG